VYRRGVLIATTTVTSFTDTGLAASTTYAYAVSAFDAAGNVSAQSQALNVTTAATSSSGFTTLAESFGNGSLLCWSGGPSSCNQTWAVGGGSGNSVAALPGTPPQGTPVNSLKMTTANGTNTYLYTAGAFPAIRSGTSFDVYFPIYVTANTMGSYDMTSLFSVSGGLGGDNPAATVYFKTVSGQLQLLAGGSNFSGTTNLSLNTWYEVQLHVASGTNNSYLEVGNAASQPFTANANDFVYANIGSFAGEADAMTYYLGGLSVNSSIQGGPSPLAYVNFENGTDGTAATPAILAGGTACGNGTWSLTSGTSTGLTISTAGEKPMLTSKTVCGVPYNDVGGTRGIYYNLLNNPGSNYAGYEWANLGQPVASVGFWFKSNNVGGPDDTNSYSIFDINSTDGTDYSTFLVRQGYAYLESATEISGETPIPISPNTWYWVTLQYVQGGNQSLSIYDANGNQVGSTITRAAVAGAGAPGSISFGRTGAESGNPNGGWWFDNIVVDYLNGSFPLLP